MSLVRLNDEVAWQQEVPARRRLRRWTVDMQAVVWIDDQPLTCCVQDISPAGARVQLATFVKVCVGATVALGLPEFPTIPAEVRYRGEGALGLEFLHDEDQETRLGRYLVSRRPQRRDPRKPLHVKAALTPCRTRSICIVKDISRMGANVSLNDATHLSCDDDVLLSIQGYGEVAATVRRIGDGDVGLRFHNALVGALPESMH